MRSLRVRTAGGPATPRNIGKRKRKRLHGVEHSCMPEGRRERRRRRKTGDDHRRDASVQPDFQPEPIRLPVDQRSLYPGAHRHHFLEIDPQGMKPSRWLEAPAQGVESPEEKMHAMHQRRAGKAAPGGHRIDMDRIGVAGQAREGVLAGQRESALGEDVGRHGCLRRPGVSPAACRARQ